MERGSMGKQVLKIVRSLVQWHELIVFTPEDGKGVTFPYEDVLIIFTIISNHIVYQLLVDDDSVVNIISVKIMVQIGIPFSKLTPIKTPFMVLRVRAYL
jgi:hypothetical protein